MANIQRVALIVLDAVGAGAQADSEKYGDAGANTLKHVVETYQPLSEYSKMRMLATIGQVDEEEPPIGNYGVMRAKAAGKDTITGHWEIAGLTLKEPFPTFPNSCPPIDRGIRAGKRHAGDRQQGGFRHGNHRGTGPGAFDDRQTDRLHIGG